jgi:hypothetical protein
MFAPVTPALADFGAVPIGFPIQNYISASETITRTRAKCERPVSHFETAFKKMKFFD